MRLSELTPSERTACRVLQPVQRAQERKKRLSLSSVDQWVCDPQRVRNRRLASTYWRRVSALWFWILLRSPIIGSMSLAHVAAR